MNNPKHLILYDGHCHLCNKSVQTVLKFDKKGIFRFASLQSETGKKITAQFSKTTTISDSIIYYHGGKFYQKSGAILRICVLSDFPLMLLSGLLLIPPPIRDSVYDFIAKKRYQWFGKEDHCILPEESFRDRFIDL